VKHVAALALIWSFAVSAAPPVAVNDALILGDAQPDFLSDFRFLIDARTPNTGVLPYALNTPLFSDYAEKFRYVYVPKGAKATYNADGVFDFPIGSAILKTFAFAADLRAPDKDVRVIETRVLLRRSSGWVALPYVWNAAGTVAELRKFGKRMDISWIHLDGKARTISYAVPNANQCKACHDKSGALTPIGPKARNLNDGKQLSNWVKRGILDRAPADAPAVPRWGDMRAPLDQRARAYLDINCGHCHNPTGPANTSGLWLDWNQPKGVNTGYGKRPTAAGRGSGDREFAIVPGHPEQSYLVFRMGSLDPGIAMPEIGRSSVHEEGVALISDWIKAQK
jgi:uncharacterized repeat protein (TIGR03806 family)